jgi:hypothetical protein
VRQSSNAYRLFILAQGAEAPGGIPKPAADGTKKGRMFRVAANQRREGS